MRFIHTTALLAACALSTVACGPVEETRSDEAIHSRSVELTDPSGESSVTVIISSYDEADLDDVDLDSLVLTVGDLEFEAVGELAEQAAEDDSARPLVYVEVVDEQLAEGVDTIDILESRAPAWRAPFMWRYHYSSRDCADVTRTSFWHKVYVSIWSKASSGSGWSSMVRDRKLANRETISRCDNGSYELKVGVEARQRGHYSVEFND